LTNNKKCVIINTEREEHKMKIMFMDLYDTGYKEITLKELEEIKHKRCPSGGCNVITFQGIDEDKMYFEYEEFEC
jgi:hypothetical protein